MLNVYSILAVLLELFICDVVVSTVLLWYSTPKKRLIRRGTSEVVSASRKKEIILFNFRIYLRGMSFPSSFLPSFFPSFHQQPPIYRVHSLHTLPCISNECTTDDDACCSCQIPDLGAT